MSDKKKAPEWLVTGNDPKQPYRPTTSDAKKTLEEAESLASDWIAMRYTDVSIWVKLKSAKPLVVFE